MSNLKIRIAKTNHVNPSTKEMGYTARVISNGTAEYEDIVKNACHNTTLHKAEAKIALELCMEAVADMLKQGYIVNLGPAGKLSPSCTGSWVANAEDLTLSSVTPKINYRPADEVASAIKGATLQWVKVSDATANDTDAGKDEEKGGTDTDTPVTDQP